MTLSTEHIDIGYRDKKSTFVVSRDINLYAHPGDLIGIVGVNGVGKSTLIRTLGGLLPELSGEVLLDQKALHSYSRAEMSRLISVVLTDPIATRNMSVEELIALGRQPYTNWMGSLTPQDVEHIEQVVQRLDLGNLRNKKCYELSDGQFQRVLIGRALAQDTPVMLLDEPTMHLDLYHKVQLLKLLREITQMTNKIVIFSSHELNLVIQLSSRVLILGEKEHAYDTPAKLISENKFQSLFPEGEVLFDPATGSFKIASL